ncbi:MAG: response regulator [Rhodopirellula sp. JB055]|uniref:response regulator n=1 Tax=Rhodopirellula sp. JB055 TaxID=3342846 RepID=UPI00370A4FC3
MLVLSRRNSQSVVFPQLDIEIEVVRISTKNVRLGIKAPPNISVLREEVFDHCVETAVPEADTAKRLLALTDYVERTRGWLASVGATDADATLQRIVADLQRIRSERLPVARPQLKALIVDDNDNETRLLASYLRMKQFEVAIAQDGKAALEQLEEGDLPDCVLLDMQMPRYDGRWTIQQIRESSQFAPLRVFGMSGLELDECGVSVGPAGLDRWFQKPLDPPGLVDAIEKETLHPSLN